MFYKGGGRRWRVAWCMWGDRVALCEMNREREGEGVRREGEGCI